MTRFAPIIILILILVPSMLRADMAMNDYYEFTQPDGSKVLLRNVGDDHFHYTTTKDGYVVTQQSRSICYADIHPDGSIRSSGIMARNSNQRDALSNRFLSSRTKGYPAYLASIKRTQSRSQSYNNKVPMQGGEGLLKSMVKSRADEVISFKTLVILVNFSDVKFTTTDPYTYFNGLFNAPNFSAPIVSTSAGAAMANNGSVRDYFLQNTNDKSDCKFEVVGPVTLPKPMAYYGANKRGPQGGDTLPQEMARDACLLAAKTLGVNFGDFTSPETPNSANPISIIYAGKAEASGGAPNTIWPHSWEIIPNLLIDGCKVSNYACSSELYPYASRPMSDFRAASIGTISHEFGHVLGLFDLYDVNYEEDGEAVGLDMLSLMAAGNHKNFGILPSGLSAIDRWFLSILDIKTPSELNTPLTLKTIDSGEAYAITTQNKDEFFLIEARSSINSKWDKQLDNKLGDKHYGMVVYHMDFSSNVVGGRRAYDLLYINEINRYADHECAMPLFTDKAKKNAYKDSYADIFFFPGPSGVTRIDASTPGPLKLWSGALLEITNKKSAQVFIYNIALNGDGTVTFELAATPYTNSGINMAREFIKNSNIDLSYIATTSVNSVKWFVDGTPLSGSTYRTTPGTHTIKAIATLENGNKEMVIRKITVK